MTATNNTPFPAPAYVYAIEADRHKSDVKIGCTTDVTRRISELSTASGCKLDIVHVVACPSKSSAYQLERALHYWLAKYRNHGEWFKRQSKVILAGFFAHYMTPSSDVAASYGSWICTPTDGKIVEFIGLRDNRGYNCNRSSAQWFKRRDEWSKQARLERVQKNNEMFQSINAAVIERGQHVLDRLKRDHSCDSRHRQQMAARKIAQILGIKAPKRKSSNTKLKMFLIDNAPAALWPEEDARHVS